MLAHCLQQTNSASQWKLSPFKATQNLLSYCYSFLLFRSPSISCICAKMLYATSKYRFRRELQGIHFKIQATDPTEMDLEVNAVKSSLMSIAPQKAVIAERGEKVDADEVKLNTIITLKAGVDTPIDGVVIDDNCEVDESTLTIVISSTKASGFHSFGHHLLKWLYQC